MHIYLTQLDLIFYLHERIEYNIVLYTHELNIHCCTIKWYKLTQRSNVGSTENMSE